MNLKKKMRRGSLAALITLALTSSALAMPTGGVVQSGDVNIGGSTDFSTVANGATIGATTDSTINWNTFNIANGETLNFNIADGKLLLNQVTGTQASDILGTMNQTGGGAIALVNPNGIHIGGNAVLDVNALTLSTLGVVTKNDTETLIREGALGARAITVDQGAQFDIARKLNLFGVRFPLQTVLCSTLTMCRARRRVCWRSSQQRSCIGSRGRIMTATSRSGRWSAAIRLISTVR